jgi:3,4-dihydroxyphenylacetate 2,3-dioxygenase
VTRGEIVGAALVAHVPTMVMPEIARKALNEGKEISLVDSAHRIRSERLDPLGADTYVVFDTHWFTTFEFVVTAHERRTGRFTSEELPRGMSQIPYDFPGDPELAALIGDEATAAGTWITPIDDPYLPIHYATTNLLPFFQGDERWISISMPQTGETDDFLLAGEAIGRAVARSGRRVVLLASGALSHKFWPLTALRDHEPSDPSHIYSEAHLAADLERLAWMEAGDHARIIDTMPEFLRFTPEARFGHYLAMIAAIGGRDCHACGVRYGDYENAVGTGQAHVWFDLHPG